jgi:hypothetical protein
LLDGGTFDDVTGASLEAGWFRSHRQSLFSSSTPPESGRTPKLIAVAKSPRRYVGAAQAWLEVAISRAKPVLAGARARLDDNPWRRAGLLLALLLSATLALRWITWDAADTAATSTDPVEAIAPTAPVARSAPTSAPATTAAAVDDANATAPEPVPAKRAVGAASAPTRTAEPGRARRKGTPRAEATKDLGKERRRSQLIDPYR